MHRLCLDFLTAVEATPPELTRLASANGLDLMAIMVHPAEGVPDFGMASDTPMRRETRQLCRNLGVAIDMTEGFLLKPDTDCADFVASLESSAWLGACCVNVLLRDPEVTRLADNFAVFCDFAGELGIEVVTEWSRRTPLPSPAEAAAFIAAADRPNARLQFDSLHLFRAGFTAIDLTALDPRIIGRAQLSDGPADMPVERQFEEALGGRLIPGEGELPLGDFIRALPADTVIGVEVPMTSLQSQGIGPEERVRRAVAGTRSLLRYT